MYTLEEIETKITQLERFYYDNWYYGEENEYKGIFTKDKYGQIGLFLISEKQGKDYGFLAAGIAFDMIRESKGIMEYLLSGAEKNEKTEDIKKRMESTTKGSWKLDSKVISFQSEEHKHVIYCKEREIVFKNQKDLVFLLNFVKDARILLHYQLRNGERK